MDIVQKTIGLADPIRAVIKKFDSVIQYAFIFGSVAKRIDTASSDIDLLVISEQLGYGELFAALEPATQILGRNVNPTIYSLEEWQQRLRERNSFVTRVIEQPKIWIIGEMNESFVG